jgi:hypothetical protein
MDFTGIFAGILMIGTGFLVKSFPNLISGYNTMTNAQKENVDIEGLSTNMRNGFIAMGLIIILGYYVFLWMGFILIANNWIPAVILVGVIYMGIRAQRFDQNKDKDIRSKLKKYFVGFVLVFSFGGLAYGLIPSKVHINDDSVQFSGMYGTIINIAEIENVQLTGKRPGIRGRTNGLSLGSVKKGFFRVDGYGKSRLLIHSHQGPYLIISNVYEEVTIINFKDRAETEGVYQRIKVLIEKEVTFVSH